MPDVKEQLGNKVDVSGTVVEISGDGMAEMMWRNVRDLLILPFLNIELLTFDLSIKNRSVTKNEVVKKATQALKHHKIGVKCSTLIPDDSLAH